MSYFDDISFKERLLNTIKDLAAMTGDYLVSPREMRRKLERAIRQGGGYHSVSNVYKSLNQLEKDGLIKKKKISPRRIAFRLTEQGRNYSRKQIRPDRRADGLSIVIIFDIPEDKHGARDAFRRYLVRNGFMLLQKSVLIGPCKFSKEIGEFARELNILKHVTILSAKIDQI